MERTNNLGVFQVEPNYPPSDILLQPSGLAEEKYAGLLAGTLSAVDWMILTIPVLIYSMVSGEGDIDNQSFDLVGNQLFSKRALILRKDLNTSSVFGLLITSLAFLKISRRSDSRFDDHSPVLSLIGVQKFFMKR